MKKLNLAKYIRYIPVLILLCAGIVPMRSQGVALKTNFLYDMTTTPNLGLEFSVGRKNTMNIVYGLNPWKFDSKSHGERYLRHWLLMPELRWWRCTKFNGSFFGIHLMGGEFNASTVDVPLPGVFFKGDNIRTGVRDTRYEGKYAGIGVTYGYQWILGRHWNIEAEIGIGYDHIWYDRYPCYECGAKISSGQSNYAGITKVGLSLLYLF